MPIDRSVLTDRSAFTGGPAPTDRHARTGRSIPTGKSAKCKRTQNVLKSHSGSVTIEAVIIFPLFLLMIMVLVLIIKIAYINMLLGHATAETVKTLAENAYILKYLNDMEDTLGTGIPDGRLPTSREAVEAIKSGIGESLSEDSIFKIMTGKVALSDFKEPMFDILGEFAFNYFHYAQRQGFEYLFGKYLSLKRKVQVAAVEELMKQNLPLDKLDINKLHYTFIKFPNSLTEAELMAGEADGYEMDDMVIMVEYRMELPIPFLSLKQVVLRQSAVERAWMAGYHYQRKQKNKSQGEGLSSIWEKNPLERGREFRKIFGGNLPHNFPVIDRFEAGKATRIDSVDVRSKTYQNDFTFTKTLYGYMDKIATYKGQEQAWGGRRIKQSEISRREWILIIPLGCCTESQKQIIEQSRKRAKMLGIEMKVEEY